jgi:hypothetical protein
MTIISILLSVAMALFGRWLQMHPDRLVIEGAFAQRDSLAARTFRSLIAVLGSFAVFAGIYSALWNVRNPENVGSAGFRLLLRFGFAVVGMFAVVYVRKQAKAHPLPQSKSVYGWWP